MNDLISREAVIDAIRYRVCQGQGNKEHICNRGSCAYCGIMEIMNDIENIPSSSGWISTKDRLPEEGEDVLVCYIGRDGKYKVGTSYRYDYNAWRWIGRVKVEYWQPLPEPPEKGDNDD